MTDTKTDAPALAAATFTTQTLPEVLEMLKLRMSARLAEQQAEKESEQQARSALVREQKAAIEMARDTFRVQAAQRSEFLETARQDAQVLPEPYRSERLGILAKFEMDIGDGGLAAFDTLIASYTPSWTR